MERKRRIFYVFIAVLALTLAGCNLLFPEKIDATIHINSDWTYSIEFTGILTDYVTRSARIDNGKLGQDELDSLKELEKTLKDDHRFRSVRYLGNESYEVEFYETGVLQSETTLIGGGIFATILTITPRQGDYVTVEGVDFNGGGEKDKADVKKALDRLGMGMDWRIRVVTDGEVVTQNAQETPWFFGLFGSYGWHIDSMDEPAPYMLIKM